MQASDRVLAFRYARALFQAAVDEGQEGRVQGDLVSANSVVRDALPVLRHPRVPPADKKRRLAEMIGSKVSQTTIRFFNLLIDKKRFDLLPIISAHFGRLVAEKNNIARAQVRSAAPLSPQAQEKLKDKLGRFAGKKIELDIRVDPEIIGGLVVRLGDWVLDSSIRGQLKQLSKKFSNGNLTQ
ncbi:MAG: ATP synthase F1 subunit delta [Elusimicrobia bacterium]|nr:ATP synthase F1 subunit delta [Elusimicrobiota bacterium]